MDIYFLLFIFAKDQKNHFYNLDQKLIKLCGITSVATRKHFYVVRLTNKSE